MSVICRRSTAHNCTLPSSLLPSPLLLLPRFDQCSQKEGWSGRKYQLTRIRREEGRPLCWGAFSAPLICLKLHGNHYLCFLVHATFLTSCPKDVPQFNALWTSHVTLPNAKIVSCGWRARSEERARATAPFSLRNCLPANRSRWVSRSPLQLSNQSARTSRDPPPPGKKDLCKCSQFGRNVQLTAISTLENVWTWGHRWTD